MSLVGSILEIIFEMINAFLYAFWPYLTVLLIFVGIGLLRAHAVILFIISSMATSIINIIVFIFPPNEITAAFDVTVKLISIASINNIIDLIFYVESSRAPILVDFIIIGVASIILFLYIKFKDEFWKRILH
ncbi:MAG: hypothetical protein C4537_07795 [Acholeplasma sp.]|nr:MAG: hypothetical protein C4537_07795 [Acholeplasma sp.]